MKETRQSTARARRAEKAAGMCPTATAARRTAPACPRQRSGRKLRFIRSAGCVMGKLRDAAVSRLLSVMPTPVRRPFPLAIITDFGYRDHYVGAMKGVIASIAPAANVIDITHGVPAQSVVAGAIALRESWRYFPPRTVFLAVVDPGVGTARAPIAIESSRRRPLRRTRQRSALARRESGRHQANCETNFAPPSSYHRERHLPRPRHLRTRRGVSLARHPDFRARTRTSLDFDCPTRAAASRGIGARGAR